MQGNLVKEVLHYCNVSVKSCTEIPDSIINYYDFTFVLNGSMTYYINGKKIILEKDEAVFLTPGTMRRREQGDDYVQYVSFNFTVDTGSEFLFDVHMKKCITPDIKKLISVFGFRHLTPGFHSREKCRNILNYILLELTDAHNLNCKNEHVLSILKYINENITRKITLQDIADHLYLSKEYTSYLFSRETGMKLTDYINEQKSLLAKSLISNNTMPLSKIWNYLGFESYDYFSKVFRKHIGIPPSHIKSKNIIY